MVTSSVCRHFVWTAYRVIFCLTHSPTLIERLIKPFKPYRIYHSVEFQELRLTGVIVLDGRHVVHRVLC